MSDPRGRHYVPEQPTPPGSLHHGGSFKKYMENKNRKLHVQFAEEAQVLGASSLFAGIRIHVNGLTNPTHQELKMLMAQNGGAFEAYYHRGLVTHIICSNLTDAKVKQFHKERDPTPIVRPEWVVDSLKGGAVLPITDYQLWRLRDVPGQQALTTFTAQSHTRSVPVVANPAAPRTLKGVQVSLQPEARAARTQPDMAPHVAASAEVPAADPPAPQAGNAVRSEHDGQEHSSPSREAASSINTHEQPAQADASLQVAANHQPAPVHSGPEAVTAQLPAAEVAQSAPCHNQSPKANQDAKAANQAAQEVAARARANCDVLRGPPLTTHNNPDFMDTYFRSSRLHFIGTWKARIEALAARMCPNAPAPAPHASGLGGNMRKAATERSIIHLDMDCFFAAVAELTDPALKGQPVAVSHSNSAQGTGEVSSANYEARKFNIHAGMFIAEAKRRCPGLVVMPYLFEKFEEISEQVYQIMLQHTSLVQPVSVDEAYLDVTGLGDAAGIAQAIREAIEQSTGCTASAGIASNMLLARLATKRAKPNGIFRLTAAQVDVHLLGLPVGELPGVGWALQRKLTEISIETVADVRKRTKGALQHDLGDKTGAALWEAAHGLDARQVEAPKARKSIGAEVNWGVRFATNHDAEVFLEGEVCKRLHAAGVRGRALTLKLKRRKAGAPEPPKFMGHGSCDNISRSVTLPHFTASTKEVAAAACSLLRALRVPCDQVAKLDNDPAAGAARVSCPMPGKAAAKPPSHFLSGRHTPFETWLQHQANTSVPEGAPPAPAANRLVQTHLSSAKPPASPSSPSKSASGEELGRDLQADDEAASAGREVDNAWQHPEEEDDAWSSPSSEYEAEDCQGAADMQHRLHPSAASDRPHESNKRNEDAAATSLVTSEAEHGSRPDIMNQDEPPKSSPSPDLPDSPFSLSLRHEGMPSPARVDPDAVDSMPGSPAADMLPSLSQMDAGAFAALPPAIQQELLYQHGRASTSHRQAQQGKGAPQAGGVVSGVHNSHSPVRRPHGTPLQALPPASQLDAAVLDALPLSLKRELERAYGFDAQRSPRKPGRGRGPGPAAVRMSKRQRASSPPPARAIKTGSTPMLVDPRVLAQLPPDMQRELTAALPSHGGIYCMPHTSSDAMPDAHADAQFLVSAPSDMADDEGACPQPSMPGLEEPRQIWAVFSDALERLANQAQSKRWHKRQDGRGLCHGNADLARCEAQANEIDLGLEKVADLCGMIVDWCVPMLMNNLEGVHFVLKQLKQTGLAWPQFRIQIQDSMQTLQTQAAAQYGAQIALQ